MDIAHLGKHDNLCPFCGLNVFFYSSHNISLWFVLFGMLHKKTHLYLIPQPENLESCHISNKGYNSMMNP